jgi:hypothetical protein
MQRMAFQSFNRILWSICRIWRSSGWSSFWSWWIRTNNLLAPRGNVEGGSLVEGWSFDLWRLLAVIHEEGAWTSKLKKPNWGAIGGKRWNCMIFRSCVQALLRYQVPATQFYGESKDCRVCLGEYHSNVYVELSLSSIVHITKQN